MEASRAASKWWSMRAGWTGAALDCQGMFSLLLFLLLSLPRIRVHSCVIGSGHASFAFGSQDELTTILDWQ